MGPRMEASVDRKAMMQNPHEARARIRAGEWTGPTADLARGYVQANLVILPADLADDFERFCRANPRALPILEVTEPGSATPARLAPGSDVRLDVPRYRVYRGGRLDEVPTDIMTLWHADYVAFLIGCSFTFDAVLRAHGIPVRHVDLGCNVPMYVTSRAAVPAGVFFGPLVVSMRPIRQSDVDRVVALTRGLPLSHGDPILIGSPEELGINELKRPDYGDAVPVRDDEVPTFWACGVTAQAAAVQSRVPLMITHAPGHMFITDLAVDGIAGRAPETTAPANQH